MNNVQGNHPETAKELVARTVKSIDGKPVGVENLYIVWFSYTLGNWKALVSTDIVDKHYWEVTYNKRSNEAYVDKYIKDSNTVITVL